MIQKALACILIVIVGTVAVWAFSYGCVCALIWAVCTILSYPMISYLYVLAIWIVLFFVNTILNSKIQ